MDDFGRATRRKIQVRFIWPLLLLLFLNSLDRVNVSFGALQMNRDIGLTPETYGFGVGLFFVGYILFQGPSMALLKGWGARRWLFAVVLFWGAVATGMAFVRDPVSFYVLRVLLGFAEAGFAPAVLYLCTQWMPRRYRAGAVATTMLAIPISIVIGGPLSGWLMGMRNELGLPGWRWMFLAEGAPTLLLAFACLFYFADAPQQAKWLNGDEKASLARELAAEDAAVPPGGRSVLRLLVSPRVWASALVWFSLMGGAYGVIFWLPQVVKQVAGGDPLTIGIVAALPWVAVGAGMLINAWRSDRTQERFWHVAVAGLLAAIGLAAAALVGTGPLALAALMLGGLGLGAAQSVFWTIPPTFLGRARAAGGITLINMVGNASGVIGPPLIGRLRQETGSFTAPIYALAVLLLAGAVLVVLLRAFAERERTA
jgi:ACS family tartrate transporter-like MFS transporter